jgi:hypothetical protein
MATIPARIIDASDALMRLIIDGEAGLRNPMIMEAYHDWLEVLLSQASEIDLAGMTTQELVQEITGRCRSAIASDLAAIEELSS